MLVSSSAHQVYACTLILEGVETQYSEHSSRETIDPYERETPSSVGMIVDVARTRLPFLHQFVQILIHELIRDTMRMRRIPDDDDELTSKIMYNILSSRITSFNLMILA